MDASVGDLRSRVEETARRMEELRQDQLSQTTVLQSRVEAAVGDREEHQSHIDSMAQRRGLGAAPGRGRS
jgi:hypothetical protein